MKRLPKWCITDKFPALYDTESATAIEMTAKVYGAMNELIDEYNKFVDTINTEIENFENETDRDIDLFKISMRQEFQDFIDVVDLKIANAESWMIENTRGKLEELILEGRISMAERYDIENENLYMILSLDSPTENASLIQELVNEVEELENATLKLTYDEEKETINLV